MLKILQGDNLEHLKQMSDGLFDLIYIDPPFNTGKVQKRANEELNYCDSYDNYLDFIVPRLIEAHRVLKKTGSLFVHLDFRECHYVKIELDKIFGRDNFMNEIIWAYDFGGRSKKKYSSKHDNIFWYVKDTKNYCFNYEELERIPYMAPEFCGPDKAEKGKTITDTWWHTIVHTNGKEKTGYPTQKPLGILTRIVKVHSKEGDELLDFFAGSGSFGKAALSLKRNITLIDQNPEAISVINKNLEAFIKAKQG